MKKFLSRLLCALLAILCLSGNASAATVTSQLENRIIEGCRYGQQVSLADYQITKEELSEVFWQLYDTGKLPWYIDRSYEFSYNSSTGSVLTLMPELTDEVQYSRALYEQRIAEVMAAAIFPEMTPLQICLSVHDYLIARCIYDETLARNTGYDLLVHGTTVCDGYSRLYMDILNRAGIPCVTVISEEMNHAWNLVQLEGSWFHVDLTWDDPSPDVYGQARHKYFLLTDDQIREEEDAHYGWETDLVCDDLRYQDGFWRDIESPIFYDENLNCYFLQRQEWDNRIRRTDTAGKTLTLYTDEESYIDIGPGRYTYFHQGLSLWNGRLYFASLNAVWSIKPDGSNRRAEYRLDPGSAKKYIRGVFVDKDMIYLTLSDHDGNHTSQIQPLDQPTGYHQHAYTQQLTPATCLEEGYTTHTCPCGLQAQSDLVKPLGHSYISTVLTRATFWSTGEILQECQYCSDSYQEIQPTVSFFQWLIDWLCGKYA